MKIIHICLQEQEQEEKVENFTKNRAAKKLQKEWKTHRQGRREQEVKITMLISLRLCTQNSFTLCTQMYTKEVHVYTPYLIQKTHLYMLWLCFFSVTQMTRFASDDIAINFLCYIDNIEYVYIDILLILANACRHIDWIFTCIL